MPSAITYPWQRRWLPITPAADALEPPYQVDSTGYVNLERWKPKLQTELAGFALADLTEQNRCVVLLGEPGIGKSQEWKTQEARLMGISNHLFLNLGDIDSEEVLRREIQEAVAAAVRDNDKAVFTLWLDSLDEGLLHISTLQSALLRVLRSALLPLGMLCLRIMCRSAVWPVAFSEDLTKLLGLPNLAAEPAFLTLLLSPLSRAQVHAAAELEGFDGEQFLTTVADADAQPLASRPVTLGLLIRLYRKHQPTFGLTEIAGRAGIYERGCLELCERPDRDRPDGHRPDAQPRLLLAGYVAMLTVLTNRRLLFAEPAPDLLGPTELDVYALGGGTTASWKEMQAAITIPALRDVFRNTGLFADLGGGRLVWAHQSYAEFLAAWYLHLTKLPVGSLRPLFRSTADPAGGIVPALHETAAWLADMQPLFWDEMLALDPVALLQSDLRRLAPTRRGQVVNRLVQWTKHLAFPPYQSPAFMQHLDHPGLAGQLGPLLTDPATPGAIARFATDLAMTAPAKGLQPLLVQQALDIALPFRLRNRALFILRNLADDEVRVALRPLRLLIPPEDESDEFRGNLLEILWPSHLTIDELLPLLTRRKDQSLFGAYQHFVHDLDKEKLALSRDNVLTALRWLNQHMPSLAQHDDDFWPQAAKFLQRQAWEIVDDSEVDEVLTDAFIVAATHHQPFIVSGTPAQRLAMLARLLHRPDRPDYFHAIDNIFDRHQGSALVQPEDWTAVYELIGTRLTTPVRTWLSEILKQLLNGTTEGALPPYGVRYDQLHRAARRFPSVKDAFAPWCQPSDLDNERVKENLKWRKRHQAQERKKARAQRARRSLTLHRMVSRTRDIRSIIQKGNAVTWHDWRVLAQRVALTKIKRGYTEPHDITKSPRWHKLTPVQQAQVASVAQTVLSQYPVLPADWHHPGQDATTHGAAALHRALLLCQFQCPAYLDTLPVAFWESWAESLVYHKDHGAEETVAGLLQKLAAAAPELLDNAVFQQADRHNNRVGQGSYQFVKLYRALPQAKFPTLLLAAIKEGAWREDFSGELLIEMMQAGFQPAWEYANQLIVEPETGPFVQCGRPRLAVQVYSWLLFNRHHQTTDPWPYWLLLSTQPAVAFEVVSNSVYHPSPHELRHLAFLDEPQLEALILWLTYAFQLAPDDVDDWDEQRPAGSMAALRTMAAAELAARGTARTWEILQGLAAHLGNAFWLQLRLDQVRENLRRNAWEPLPPETLAALTRDATRRWVRSAVDLQELLLESLDRFQADLQGEPTTAQVLWVPLKDSSHKSRIVGYEVRDENFLSDVLRQHFRQDLQRANILVKREVEIRPSLGKDTGQRTDIFVEAFTRSSNEEKIDVVTVVIEVKLSKHKETETALTNQLAAYLADQHYKHGIFLVGWHYGQYDPKPPRKKDLPELAAMLTQQADALADSYAIEPRILDIRLPADAARM